MKTLLGLALLLLLVPPGYLDAGWLNAPARGGFLKISPGCDCTVTGVCDCGPGCACDAKTLTSTHGNAVEFRKVNGSWVPVGDGWTLDGVYWTRQTAPTVAAPMYYQPAPTFMPALSFGGRGGCVGGG